MPRWVQLLLHLGAIAAGSYVAYATGSPLPLVVSSGSQAVIGGVAQIYNTNGTPQSQPYEPSKQ